MSNIKRALFSVADKEGILELAQELTEDGVEIIATGGTAKKLKNNKIDVIDISEETGYPELLEGRVKTLHPAVMAGILARRGNKKDIEDLKENEIEAIDLIVCNLYAFADKVKQDQDDHAGILEEIDIGGQTLIRSAAKNYEDVVVLTDCKQYQRFIDTYKEDNIDKDYKFELARAAFKYIADYDQAISDYFNKSEQKPDNKINFKDNFEIKANLDRELKYGENPHQKAAIYRSEELLSGTSLLSAKQLNGDELSYNNINDSQAALNLILEFEEHAATAIIKHTNPCGLAIAHSPVVAFRKAYAGDPQSAYGSIVAFNREVGGSVAREMIGGRKYIEIILAPSYTEDAVEALVDRWSDIKLLELEDMKLAAKNDYEIKSISGGFLLQEKDIGVDDLADLKQVAGPYKDKEIKEKELKELYLATMAAKHVKSNAIALARGEAIVGIGAGQMSRVDAVRLASKKAAGRQFGGVLASDAFFPYPDAIEIAAENNIKSIIQPGGSIRDEDVIKACDEHGIKMYFTGYRHFKH
ncbi:MAG: bifunctional phosphoribosylaminoimidazolecarboxamide formyltransferase/IMP cyclohydrolase [Bacillota bacterium]